jgi:APA family basic amino acid/polyamine antiporter
MVGSGVLTTSGFTVLEVGSNALMVALWVAGGAVALCGALTLAELSASVPRAGGEYAILAEAYGPLPAFLAGWVSLLVGFAAPIAATASAAASYLLSPSGPWPDSVGRAVASLAIVAFAVVHATGRAGAARTQGAITTATVATLALFVVAGLAAGRGRVANLLDLPTPRPGLAVDLLFSLVYVAYAYTGWNGASYLAAEVTDVRSLPRAIVIGTALVVGLYAGLNAVYALALPAEEVRALAEAEGKSAVEPIALVAAGRLFGPRAAAGMSAGFGVMLLASLSALVLTGPRIAYAMARAGQLPAIVGRLSGRGRTPAVATAMLAAGALALLWTGSFERLVVFSGVGLALFSLLTIGAVFVLRRRPDLPRPFRTPGYPLVPMIYLAATLALVAAAFRKDPVTSGLALAGILAGVPLYAVCVGAGRGRKGTGAGDRTPVG